MKLRTGLWLDQLRCQIIERQGILLILLAARSIDMTLTTAYIPTSRLPQQVCRAMKAIWPWIQNTHDISPITEPAGTPDRLPAGQPEVGSSRHGRLG